MFRQRRGREERFVQRMACMHCHMEGSADEVAEHGGHHRVLQGCTDRCGMACPRAEGARFKCTKCPVEFVVMWRFVWATDPDAPMEFADRGPDHTVRHHVRHHDYWCDMKRAGMANVPQVLRCENEKMQRFFSHACARTDKFISKFGEGASHLLELLPRVQHGKVVQLGDPALRLQQGSKQLQPFHDPDTHEACMECFQVEKQRAEAARDAVRKVVRCLHHVRLLRVQVSRQLLADCGAIQIVLDYLERSSLLPTNLDKASFIFNELEAPQSVIQEVDHADTAADLDASVAADRAEQDWADHVAWLIEQGRREEIIDSEPVFLLEYTRYPEAFRKALCEGAALQSCRTALDDAQLQWHMQSGAKVFVHPCQYKDALVAVAQRGIGLRPFHVVVAESLLQYVELSLADIPCRQGARVRNRHSLGDLPRGRGQASESEAVDGEHVQEGQECRDNAGHDGSVEWPLEVKRTFLCAVQRLRNPNSVPQSTTEAHGGGLNPRRLRAAPSISIR